MSNEQEKEQQQQISSSFSSPEFLASKQEQQHEEEETYTSGIESSPASTSTAATTTKMVKSATGITTTTTTTQNRVANTTTRDSGFGDSIAEDTSASSTSTSARNLGRTEHGIEVISSDPNSTDIVLTTKIFPGEKSKLKSVEEDIDVVSPSSANPDDEKEFITIVKTTKMTTKVKQVKPNSNGSGKKNKKKGKKNQQQQQANTSVETSETTNNTAVTANSDEDRTSNISSSKDEDEEMATAGEEEKLESAIKVDINKATDEFVFQPVAEAAAAAEAAAIEAIGEALNQQDLLNSTALDSEEILSDYSSTLVQQTTTTVQINGGPIIEQSTIVISHPPPDSINELVNVSDVLSDVTHSLMNQAQVEAEAIAAAAATAVAPSTSADAKVDSTKKDKEGKKKPHRFNLFARFKNRSKSRGKETDENKKAEGSPSNKRKLDTSQTRSSQQQQSQQAQQPQQANKQLKTEASSSASSTYRRTVLLSDEEKDSILYEKPECVELILGELIEFSRQDENIESFADVPLTTDMGFLTRQLCPMISRALDLLRHDRVESFEHLAEQLSVEYDEKIRKRRVLDQPKINIIFNTFLKDAILNERILKDIKVDKSRRPHEEQIEFDSNAATSLKWLRRFSGVGSSGIGEAGRRGSSDRQLGVKLNEKLKLNIDEKEMREQIEKQLNAPDEENFDVSTNNKITTITTKTIKTSTQVDENEAIEKISRSVVTKTTTTTINGGLEAPNCGVTPPPTPQNESNSDQQSVAIESKVDPALIERVEGEKVYLKTVKEPPIVFLSDFETDNKIAQAKKIDTTQPTVSASEAQPTTSAEAAVANLKKGEEVNAQNQGKSKKKSGKSKSAFSCLSCAGGGQAKFDDEEKPVKSKKEEKKEKIEETAEKKEVAQKTTTSPEVATAREEEQKPATTATTTETITKTKTEEHETEEKSSKKKTKKPKTTTKTTTTTTETVETTSPKTKSKSVVETKVTSPAPIETNPANLNSPDKFVDIPTVITLDIQTLPIEEKKEPSVKEKKGKKPKKSSAKTTTSVPVTTTVVTETKVVTTEQQPAVETETKPEQKDQTEKTAEETSSEKQLVLDSTKFISLDTEEAVVAPTSEPSEVQVEKVELVSTEVIEKEEIESDETKPPVVVVETQTPENEKEKQQQPVAVTLLQPDEGPITPPTTPELKAKKALENSSKKSEDENEEKPQLKSTTDESEKAAAAESTTMESQQQQNDETQQKKQLMRPGTETQHSTTTELTIAHVNTPEGELLFESPPSSPAKGALVVTASPKTNLKTTSTDITRIEINTETKSESNADVITKTVIIKKNTIETTFENVDEAIGAVAAASTKHQTSVLETVDDVNATLDDVKKRLEVIEFNFPSHKPTDGAPTASTELQSPPAVAAPSTATKADQKDGGKDKKKKEKPKKEKKIKVKPDDAVKISCFSCKSRKARQEKEKQEKEKDKEQQPQLELKIEVPQSKPIDASLFQGLDNNVIIRTTQPDQSTEVITITRVGPPSPDQKAEEEEEKTKKSSIESSAEQTPLNEENKQTETAVTTATIEVNQDQTAATTASMIGSTSLDGAVSLSLTPKLDEEPAKVEEEESQQQAQPEAEVEQEQEQAKVEVEEVKEEPIAVKEEVDVKIETPVIEAQITDVDIKVETAVPEPPVSVEVLPVLTPVVEVKVAEEKKPAAAQEAEKKAEKEKKQKSKKKPISCSCFSGKQHKDKRVDKEKAPTAKPAVEIEAKAKSDEKVVAGEEKGAKTTAVEVVLPPSDWSIGLDRGADETVKRKDPEVATKPAIIEASLTKEVKSEPAKTTAVEIEVPSVIDMPLLAVIDSSGAATKAQKEESLSKQLTIDSPGAIIKIDRQPDHAVIPIVVATTTTTKAAVSPKAEDEKTAQTSTAVEVSKSDSKKKAKKEKEVKHKKTSPIDLPLIDILVPKPKTQTSEDEKKSSSKKDKKQKKEKKDKSKSTKEKKDEPQQPATLAKLEPRPIEIFITSPPDIIVEKTATKEEKAVVEVVEETKQPESETEVEKPIVEEPEPVKQEEEQLIEEPVVITEVTTDEQLPKIEPTKEEEESTSECRVETLTVEAKEPEITEMIIEPPQEPEITVEPPSEVTIETVEKQTADEFKWENLVTTTSETVVDVPPLDIQVPDLSISVETPSKDEDKKADIVLEPVASIQEEVGGETTVRLPQALAAELPAVEVKVATPKKEKTTHTGFFDMPIIDILVPKEKKEKKHAEKKPVDEKKTKKDKQKKEKVIEVKTAPVVAAAETTATQQNVYIDVPIVDLITPPEVQITEKPKSGDVEKQPQSPKDAKKKKEKKVKVKVEKEKAVSKKPEKEEHKEKEKTASPETTKKKPNTTLIDMPLVDILAPSKIKKHEKRAAEGEVAIEGTSAAVNDEPKVSCFSCKARKAAAAQKKEKPESKKKSQKSITKVDISAPVSTPEQPVAAVTVTTPVVEVPVEPAVDIELAKSRIEEQIAEAVADVAVGINEATDKSIKVEVEAEVPPVNIEIEEFKKSSEEEKAAEEEQPKEEAEKETTEKEAEKAEEEPTPIEIKPEETQIVAAAVEPIIVEEHTNTLIVKETTTITTTTTTHEESSSSNAATTTEQVTTTHVESESPREELNITQVLIDQQHQQKPALEIVEVDLAPKEIPIVEEVKPVVVAAVETAPKSVDIPLFNVNIETEKTEKTTKKKTKEVKVKEAKAKKEKQPVEAAAAEKKEKKSSSVISCFSCKSRKAKQDAAAAKQEAEKPAEEAKPVVENIYTPASPVISASSKTPKLDTELFKGLDRPVGAELTIKTPTPSERVKKDVEVVVEKVIEQVVERVDETKEKSAAVEMTVEKPLKISVTAPVVHIDVQPPKQEATSTSTSPKKDHHIHIHAPKIPCISCTGEKEEKDKPEGKQSEPTVKPADESVLSPPLVDGVVVDITTPPKKPPRGHLVDDDKAAPIEHIHLEATAPHVQDTILLPSVVVATTSSQKEKEPTETTKTTTKTSTKKSQKTSEGPKTSILDLPIIDILVPKEKKDKKEKKKKEKKEKKSTTKKSEEKEKEEMTKKASSSASDKKTEELKVVTTTSTTKTTSREVDSSLFRGLDPERINADLSDKYKSLEVKGSGAVELNQPEVEIFVEKTTLLAESVPLAVVAVEEEKKEEKEKKEHHKHHHHHEKKKDEPVIIDFPTIIDIERPREKFEYKSPGKPLPHKDPTQNAKIGMHKIGDEEPVIVAARPTTSAAVTTTTTTTTVQKTTTTIELPTSVAVDVSAATAAKKPPSDDTVKKLSAEERKLLKSKQSDAIEYLKSRSGFKLDALEKSSAPATNTKKELKAREKQADKVFKRATKVLSKDRSKPLTYTSLRKKLEKSVSKPNASDLNKQLDQIQQEIESGTLISTLRTGVSTDKKQQQQSTTSQKSPAAATTTLNTTSIDQQAVTSQSTTAAAATEAETDGSTEPGVLRRFPSLTWRQANERARILFYKGRTPSIHYNEKRDSFRVSMLAEVIKDGQHKVAEVPVTDDDVRRLLNSFGLYWDGESISLLAKSDEIFTSAQQEAFDFILSGAAAAAAATTTSEAEKPSEQTEEKKETETETETKDQDVKITLIA